MVLIKLYYRLFVKDSGSSKEMQKRYLLITGSDYFKSISTLYRKGLFLYHISFRELRHPSIVEFFGTNLHKSSSGTKVMVILELCECSLKTRIMTNPEDAPSRSRDAAVRANVLLWAIQILDALRYVHDQTFVHRDLKLDNLLVSKTLAHDSHNLENSTPYR